MATPRGKTASTDDVSHFEPEELRRLIDKHGGALALYARQWCHAPDDALQEALLELVRQDMAPDQPIAWLYKTVRRRAMNLARAERRRDRHQRKASEQRPSWFLPPDDSLDDPIDLERLLRKLPRLEREIVVARVWGELTWEQIAELVELSSSSVHRRYQRALKQLRQLTTTSVDHPERCP